MTKPESKTLDASCPVWVFVGELHRYENGVLKEVSEHSGFNSGLSEPVVFHSDHLAKVAADREWTNKLIIDLVAERQLSAALKAKVAELEAVIATKTAVVDSLMLEFCPDEMTPEQVEEWGKRQRPCSPELQAAVDAALKGGGDV